MLSTQPAPAAAARISQVLPTVKCSSCRVDLPLDELGSHVCAPAAAPMPMPTVSIPPRLGIPKPAMSPGAAAALLPTRLQGLVKPQGPNTQPPPPQPNTLPPPRTNTPIQQPPRNNTPVQPPPPRNNAPIQIPRNNTPTQPPRNTTPLQRPTLNTTLPIKAAYPPARPSPLSRDAPARAVALPRRHPAAPARLCGAAPRPRGVRVVPAHARRAARRGGGGGHRRARGGHRVRRRGGHGRRRPARVRRGRAGGDVRLDN
ncbi:Paxillin-like protein 1 [Mycena indigotica]|uniref:Paxillin-like protein 1 n=1 Tax=Mycena indigotica TaxID=2126181 RepID=A0A8H6W0F0_9AGAR|nr:Paxillin-like protein 1 [Mycena indigotica]KAF7294819.1 Paxillin-like protein 1 [Mycena indigotica]